jgi:hypothetical protein
MTMHDDDDLTPAERDALAALPRAHDLPPGLEDRVAASLRSAGRFRRPGRGRTIAAVAAAAALCVAAGFAAGRLTAASAPAVGAGSYMLLLYGATAAPDELADRAREYGAWAATEREAGRLVGAARLDEVRRVLGPIDQMPAPGRDPVGFFIIRASSAEEAADAASRCPHLKYGGTVAVRAMR